MPATTLGVLLWIPGISTILVAPLLFTFFAIFPSSLFRQRWPWALVWMPWLAAWLSGGTYFYRLIYQPEAPARWQEFFVRAFALEAGQRPNSARAFFSELERALSL